jgi:hypothetical protein
LKWLNPQNWELTFGNKAWSWGIHYQEGFYGLFMGQSSGGCLLPGFFFEPQKLHQNFTCLALLVSSPPSQHLAFGLMECPSKVRNPKIHQNHLSLVCSKNMH